MSTMRSAICVSFDLHNSIYIFLRSQRFRILKILPCRQPLCEKGNNASMSYHCRLYERRIVRQKETVALLLVRWKSSVCSERHEQKLREPVLEAEASRSKESITTRRNQTRDAQMLKIKASRNNRTLLTLDMMTS